MYTYLKRQVEFGSGFKRKQSSYNHHDHSCRGLSTTTTTSLPVTLLTNFTWKQTPTRIVSVSKCGVSRWQSFSKPLSTTTSTNLIKYSQNKQQRAIDIKWTDGTSSSFQYCWLRDHCSCSQCLHPTTLQRQVDTFTIPLDLEPSTVQLDKDHLIVKWSYEGSTDHSSVFSLSWLKNCFLPPKSPHKIPWGSEISNNVLTIPYEEVNSSDRGVLSWLNHINTYGFAIVSGVPTDITSNRKLIEKISYVRENIYGSMWDFTADMAMDDTAYTNLELKVHTDGCYLRDPPGLQMFHLVHFDGVGGQTVIVDGLNVANQLKQTHPDAFDFFLKTPIPFHYIDKNHYLFQRKTIFEQDQLGSFLRMSFNNDDRAPLDLPHNKITEFYKHLHVLMGLLRKPENEHRFQMTPGNVIVYNNWRVLHGRTSFTGPRRIVGCYLNYEDFQSKLITLQRKLGNFE